MILTLESLLVEEFEFPVNWVNFVKILCASKQQQFQTRGSNWTCAEPQALPASKVRLLGVEMQTPPLSQQLNHHHH